jgi:hypothetical protein
MSLSLTLLLCLGGDERAPAAPAGSGMLRASEDGAPELGILLRPFLTFSAREGGLGSEDVSGSVFEDLDLWLGQWTRAFAWKVSADLEDGSAALEDAWARVRLRDDVGLTVGQFKPRVVRSGSILEEALLFRSRTFLGAAFDVWDDGFELATHGERWSATLALVDGANGSESDHFWSLRGEWELYESDLAEREGARGAENFLVSRLGIATFADVSQSANDGGGLAFDLALTYGPYSLAGEWAHLQDEFVREVDVFNGHVFDLGDGDPMSFTFARRVGPEFEAALRYQRAEDADDTTATLLAVTWARAGAAARFVAEAGVVEAESRDFTILSAGVVVGGSGMGRGLEP